MSLHSTRRGPPRGARPWLASLALCAAATVHGADSVPYRVELATTGDAALDTTLAASSELESLRQSAPVSPFGLIARARGDGARFKTVLESFGYYQSTVSVQIDGRALSDLDLPQALAELPRGREAKIQARFTLGPLYRLGKIEVSGDLPPQASAALGLATGDPAVASAVLAAGRRLEDHLQAEGYAFARVDPPVAYEDATQPLLDLSFHAVTGAKVPIGSVAIVGLKRVREDVARRSLRLRTGQPFSPAAVENARRDLLALGPFGAVSVRLGERVDDTGGVPVTFRVRERPRHAVSLNAAYSSDLGGSGGVTWTDRTVFGGAGQLSVAASVLNYGGNASTAVGYDDSVKLLLPDFLAHDQSLQVAVGAIKQSLQAYDQTARSAGLTLTRKLSNVWSASAGASITDEQIRQAAVDSGGNTPSPGGTTSAQPQYAVRNYTLLAAPLSVSYDSTNLGSPLDDPTHGMRDSLSVAPTRALGHPNSTFIVSQLKLADYLDVGRWFDQPGRTVLASRLLAGRAEGAGELSLPPDQRFYGGGSGTIRGFRYQSVGPVFVSPPAPASLAGLPIGGTAIVAASLELRQRILGNWGAAAFVDAGEVSASLRPLPSTLRIGAGAGVRYYTPIGPVRLDVAVPTRRFGPNQDNFEIYIGLGQAF